MERRKCPLCGEEISLKAKKCRYCGEWLTNDTASSVQSAARQPVSQPVRTPQQMSRQPVSQPAPAPQPNYQYEAVKTEHDKKNYENNSLLTFFKAYFINPFIRRYADFNGYTSRKSFWLTYVATMILSVGLTGLILLLTSFGIGGLICGSIISGLIGLAMIVPLLALSVRRLRDAGKNPWLILLGLIPAVGSIILLIFFCMESQYEDTEEEGSWQMPDWIVTGVCALLLILGIIFSSRSLDSMVSKDPYDLGSFGEEEVVANDSVNDDYTEVVEETPVYDVRSYSSVLTLVDLAENLDPQYFTYKLKTYRMGSDKKMEQTYSQTGSTNIPIGGTGMISNHNIELKGWITEDGTIHGRYHNENGINLDFNGYIRPDNSLYIQLGHDSEKSDWYLYPEAHDMPDCFARYDGKWGKSQKDSYVIFSSSYDLFSEN